MLLSIGTNIGDQSLSIQDKIDGLWQLSNHLYQDQLYIVWLVVFICALLLAVIPLFFFFRLRKKHVQERLKNKESLLHDVLNKVPYPVYLKSSVPPYDVVYMNHATTEYWKNLIKAKEAGELVDKHLLKRQQILKEVLATGAPRRVVMPLRLSNKGDNRAIDIILQRIYHGDVPYLLTTVVDVTSQIEAKEHALLIERMKLSFLASVSEELSAPLNDLLHAIEQLDGKDVDAEDETELIDTIHMTGQYVLDKIDYEVEESLNLSSAHSIKQRWQSLDYLNSAVDRYVQKVISRYDYMIDYSITFQIESGECFIDTFLWMQALDRMVSLAIETMKHGMLRMTVGYRAGFVFLFIEDDGPGYAKDLQHKLYKYQPVQVDASSISDLSTAQMQIARFYPEFSIIRELGGSMGVYSVEEQGATQWVYVPLKTRDLKCRSSWKDYKFDALLRHCNLYSLFKEKESKS